MATRAADSSALEPEDGLPDRSARPWDNLRRLSSVQRTIEQFLASRDLERGPWLVVAFGVGIAGWLVLPDRSHWLAFATLCAAAGLAALALDREGELQRMRVAIASLCLMALFGLAVVWCKSALVGTPGIARPTLVEVQGRVIDRQDRGAEDTIRLVMATRLDPGGPMRRIRINLSSGQDDARFVEGSQLRVRARLMPPASPMLPGSYDFARAAWFQGLSATGRALGRPVLLEPAPGEGSLGQVRRALADHVRAQLAGSPGAIAAAFASGDRGAIARTDEDAMRDAGLSHLLSISGLHVSAVVAAVYVLVIRLLALVPAIALRVRLPLVAATMGALAGIGYTVLTGSEVPTVRSCVGAVLVLSALALGRDPLSLRMAAVAAFFVLLFWPESLWGPSFQMSFASVIAIIAFHNAAPARRFLAPRDEGTIARTTRHLALLLATGVVIELVLMPIAVFHFHRAGLYGAAVNVVAIPLTTFVTMPLIALALVLDLAGWGAPVWYCVGKSLDLLLWMAHVVAAQPGAVTMMPGMGRATFGLFLAGLLWLALWSGRIRLAGFVPLAMACMVVLSSRAPDVLVSGDGRQIGVAIERDGRGPGLLVLREGRSDFTRDTLLEAAGLSGDVLSIEQAPNAHCNADFCGLALVRGGRSYILLMSRGRDLVPIAQLRRACAASDIVIADRRLPQTCRPRLLKADRMLLRQTGGLAINLTSGTVHTVAETQGHHGWYRWAPALPRRDEPSAGQHAAKPAPAPSSGEVGMPAPQ